MFGLLHGLDYTTYKNLLRETFTTDLYYLNSLGSKPDLLNIAKESKEWEIFSFIR